MKTKSKVNLHLDHVRVAVNGASDELLKLAALRTAEQAQLNIRGNDQIDTGFMVNSVYTRWRGGSTHSQAAADAAGHTTSSKTGRTVSRDRMAPDIELPGSAAAATVVGANYAIYQEVIKPFLWPAAKAVAAAFEGLVKRKLKRRIDD